MHPLFTGGMKHPGKYLPSPPSLIHYLHLDPFAPSPSSASSSKVTGTRAKIPIIFYDLDGTLIKPRSAAKFPKGRDDWIWWHPSVPSRLAEEWERGRHIVVISNQGDSREKIRAEWREKVPLIAAKVGDRKHRAVLDSRSTRET